MWKKGETARRVTDRTKFPVNFTVPRGNDGIWKIIREVDTHGEWTIREVESHTLSNGRTVRDYVLRLVRGGIAEQRSTHEDGRKINRYRLKDRPVETPRLRRDGSPYPERLIDTLWRSMKMARSFTASELAREASSEERVVNVDTARRYLHELSEVGIVHREKPAPDEETHYRVLHNIGGQAPRIMAGHVVYDPNSDTLLGEPEAKEVQP